MIQHFIRKCELCKRVILQCRCPSLDKKLEWGICHVCAANPEKKS